METNPVSFFLLFLKEQMEQKSQIYSNSRIKQMMFIFFPKVSNANTNSLRENGPYKAFQ